MDSAYLAKYYINEPDSTPVRAAIRKAGRCRSSAWAVPEVTCAIHRHMRERKITLLECRRAIDLFREHVEAEIWNLSPVTDLLLQTTVTIIRSLPKEVYLRAGDAIHLATALQLGEPAIWTNDRHLLAAAEHVGLAGRSVTS